MCNIYEIKMFCSKGTDKRLHLLKFSELYPNVMHAMMFQPHHQTSKWWIIKCKWGKCTQFKRRWGQLLWIVIASLTSDVFLLWKVQQITKVSKYVVRLSCWPSLPFWWICICRKSFNASRQKIHWFLHFFLSTKVHNCYLGQLQNFQNFQRCPGCRVRKVKACTFWHRFYQDHVSHQASKRITFIPWYDMIWG